MEDEISISFRHSDVVENVRKAVAEVAGVDVCDVTMHTKLAHYLDSLDRTELAVKLEECFNITLPENDAVTVAELCELVSNCQAET